MISTVIYYTNLLRTKIKQKYIINYDKHTYSVYYEKQRKYAGRKTLEPQIANTKIKEKILERKPMMIARFGSTELYNIEIFDLEYKPRFDVAIYMLTNNSGFFPSDEKYVRKFVDVMKESCSQIDMLAFWNMFREEHYIKKLMKENVELFQLRYLEPWFVEKPWTSALKGKKVLVIHPFEETILQQYEKREKLFSNPEILPEFELKTIKAVQTLAGEKDRRFESWFDALKWMYDEAVKMEFDIALIGCGAYGLPLAAKLKQAGKQAIHMGGVLQVLFGIKGKRWDDDPVVSELYNEYWVRPTEIEKLKGADKVEGGCYW